MSSSTQIASRISDVRIEQEYEYLGEDGMRRKVQIVEFPTVDDLMLQGMKNVAAELKFKTEYTSVMNYDIVTELIKVVMPVER